ncbi:hypothetical protein G4Y79_19885 [Phototrophicus methaneseepsis]|uniref:CvpA family protein n=1 Tax=Phototrophicus methaneseepsis TaxID=2710758 RepID=A0A7S8E7Q3_9CHLR|nr:hypothetical protein [Phototrophicus methaneseepsis]QPC81925.1 hypothetical protein G4Y79_19885 [Phototrophicus methaneseepsis]
MIQLSSFMWAMAIFFAVMGFLRGWTRELVGSAGILLGIFALFQFDPFLRSTFFVLMDPAQSFWIQAGIFIVFVFIVYNADEFGEENSQREFDLQESLLGSIAGFLNGYLVGGTLWYFLDINEYPIPQVIAPALDSPSAQSLNAIPMVLLSGVSGGGDALAILVIILLMIVLYVA